MEGPFHVTLRDDSRHFGIVLFIHLVREDTFVRPTQGVQSPTRTDSSCKTFVVLTADVVVLL